MLEPIESARPTAVALAAFAALVGLVLGGCERDPAKPSTRPPAAAPASKVVATVSVPLLDRAGLLAAMDAAASAYASGDESGAPPLSGRRFVVRQAFGCATETSSSPAASPAEGVPSWSRSPDGKSLRITLTPIDWTQSPLTGGGGTQTWEAVEGVWLTYPWLKTDDCPRIPVSDDMAGMASAPTPQTMGLASVFEVDSSRLGRRNGRAYDYVMRGVDNQPAASPSQGFRLVMEGRMAAFPDGRSIHCRASGPEQRPVCIAAVQVDRVTFEDAAGTTLSEWRGG